MSQKSNKCPQHNTLNVAGKGYEEYGTRELNIGDELEEVTKFFERDEGDAMVCKIEKLLVMKPHNPMQHYFIISTWCTIQKRFCNVIIIAVVKKEGEVS